MVQDQPSPETPSPDPSSASPKVVLPHGSWGEAVEPIAQKFDLAANFPSLQACWSGEGARATGTLLREMVRLLDVDARDAIQARDRAIDLITAKNERLIASAKALLSNLEGARAHASLLESQLREAGLEPSPAPKPGAAAQPSRDQPRS
jgi:hypothetical protein